MQARSNSEIKVRHYQEQKDWPEVEADTIPKLLRLRTSQYGDRTFIRHKHKGIWQRFSYNETYDSIRRLGLGLAKLGLKRGDTIAIAGENAKEFFWTEYAAFVLGAKVVCLYPDMTSQEMAYILKHSEASFFIAEDQEQVDKVLEMRGKLPLIQKVVFWDSSGMWHYKDAILLDLREVQDEGEKFAQTNPNYFENSIQAVKGEDIAVISYTSGTTALPKGVIMTHSRILDDSYRVAMAVDLKPFSQYLSYISPAWGVEQIYGVSLGLLVPFIINFPEKPETVLSNIHELGAEILVFGPRQWESLISIIQSRMIDAGAIKRKIYEVGMKIGKEVSKGKINRKKISPIWKVMHPIADLIVLKALRDNLGLKKAYLTMAGGGSMSADIFLFFHAMGIMLRNLYGNTEMGLLSQHTGEQFDPGTLGTWLTSHPQLGRPLEWKLKENGELLVRGASGFVGYFRDPDATKKSLEDGWFCTGDAVYMTDEKELVFLDRVSDLRQLADGQKFPPQFIETRLRYSPYIKEAIVLGDETKSSVSTLINIDFDNVSRWAEKKGISYSTFPDLSQKEKVRELIREAVDYANKFLEKDSQIKWFVNLPKELDADEAELTRTRKLRREFIEERYKDLIKAIYEGKKEFTFRVPVEYRDGRKGFFEAITYINSIRE